MESAIFTNMSRLRLVSIIIAVITVSSTFGLVSLLEEVTYTDESRASDASERDQTILAISLIPAFIIAFAHTSHGDKVTYIFLDLGLL